MLERLHPTLSAWFRQRFGEPTHAQAATLPEVLAGRSVLLSSPTGSGKTLAGFLGVLDHLLHRLDEGKLPAQTLCLYVSPLRALTYDMQKNLAEPLREMGLEGVIRVGLRNGDTSATERARLRKNPPHILLTTPESLAILLPQESAREGLRGCRFVLVDELHALAENKRGAHLTLSLERLESLCSGTGSLPVVPGNHGQDARATLIRVGLSATAAPLSDLSQLLCGAGRDCVIIEGQVERRRRVEVLSPLRREPYPAAGWTAQRVMQDLARLIQQKSSVIVFCNTRSGAENISLRLKQTLPKLADDIETHHSSLDRDLRLEVEDKLKAGQLRAVVCSTSLEMGIDIGAVDCVVMISTPKGISRAIQRIGRSGHSIHQESHGVLVATNVNDLMECVVCAAMTRRSQLDAVRLLEKPYDVLAQHLVGLAMEGNHTPDSAYALVTRAWTYRDLSRDEFDRVLRYLIGGGRSLEKSYLETFGKVLLNEQGLIKTPNRKVERDYLVNIGTIATEGMVRVYLGRRRLGELDERFVKQLKIGDLFVLAGRTVKLIETGIQEIKVEAADGRLPTVPSWNANKMPLSSGLADEVTKLRTAIAAKLSDTGDSPNNLEDWLVETFLISSVNAGAIVKHCRNQLRFSAIPTEQLFLIELYRETAEDDEPFTMRPAQRKPRRRLSEEEEEPPQPAKPQDRCHFFFHSLIGRSANDALSRIIAHRVNEAVGGNAMVTIDDYGFLLTLHSFQQLGLEEWRTLFHADRVAEDMQAALRESELVKWQFRGVAQTGLLVPRKLPGAERNLKQLRWSSEILFRVLSEHEPEHPLLQQAYREATHTFLDLPRAEAFLQQVQNLEWKLLEVPAVTPFSFGIYASKIKEGMMLEAPEEAIERLWRKFEAAS
jgi:ATP-dependent helicase Lhr and Lhr-like helicase